MAFMWLNICQAPGKYKEVGIMLQYVVNKSASSEILIYRTFTFSSWNSDIKDYQALLSRVPQPEMESPI